MYESKLIFHLDPRQLNVLLRKNLFFPVALKSSLRFSLNIIMNHEAASTGFTPERRV